jgi:hypothetical protein
MRFEESYIDKSPWACGPWDQEPDKLLWEDSATGLPCLALRHTEQGDWRGYVGVPQGHPAFKAFDDDDLSARLAVHGGVTFAGPDPEGDGQPTGAGWWLGFDCGHIGDLIPGQEPRRWNPDDEYRDLHYVVSQCAALARQLWELAEAEKEIEVPG